MKKWKIMNIHYLYYSNQSDLVHSDIVFLVVIRNNNNIDVLIVNSIHDIVSIRSLFPMFSL